MSRADPELGALDDACLLGNRKLRLLAQCPRLLELLEILRWRRWSIGEGLATMLLIQNRLGGENAGKTVQRLAQVGPLTVQVVLQALRYPGVALAEQKHSQRIHFDDLRLQHASAQSSGKSDHGFS